MVGDGSKSVDPGLERKRLGGRDRQTKIDILWRGRLRDRGREV